MSVASRDALPLCLHVFVCKVEITSFFPEYKTFLKPTGYHYAYTSINAQHARCALSSQFAFIAEEAQEQ